MIFEDDKEKLMVELEFVQCLSNPSYLTFLSQNGYLDKPEFLAYLRYLQYWHRPEYSHHIQYPNSLFFLDKLLDDKFREEIHTQDFVNFVHKQQYYAWESHKNQ